MTRAVIWYADESDKRRQVVAILRYVEERDYQVVGTAEGIDGWTSANRMIADGEADVVVYASRRYLPSRLESVTSEIRTPTERRPKRLG